MNITIQREALLKPLQAISSIADKKQSQPILACALLTTKENALQLAGTDLEIALVGLLPILSLEEAGSVAVPAKKLFDICRALPEKSIIALTVKNDTLSLRTNDSCFNLKTLPAQDFPALEEHAYPTQCQLQTTQLKQLLTKTHFAMGQQDVRQYLNGALLHINKGKLLCVAMDGHRLAWSSVSEENVSEIDMRVILPRKSVLELIRLLDDSETTLTLSMSEQRIRIEAPDFILTSKLMHARYPDYQRLIPQGTATATLDREIIRQALARVAILSNEKCRGVHFHLEGQQLLLSANNMDQEHAQESLSLDYSGEKMEISFNISYLLDAISALTTQMVRFIFTDLNSGLRIQSTAKDNDIYVVMPMRL